MIGGYLHAPRPRLVHHLDDPAHLSPIVAAGGLQMSDLDWHTGCLADADDLIGSLEDAPRLVAHVRDVDAAEFRYWLGDLNHFFCARIDVQAVVLEPGADSPSPLAHSLSDDRSHAPDLFWACRSQIVATHHLASNHVERHHHHRIGANSADLPPSLGFRDAEAT